MNEEMSDLYFRQERFADLFQLQLKTGKFETALDLALEQRLWDQESAVQESLIAKLLDYVWAGRISEPNVKELPDITDEARPKTKFHERAGQWRAASHSLSQDKIFLETSPAVVKNYLLISRMKFMVEHDDLLTMIEKEGILVTDFEVLVDISQNLILTGTERAWSIVLLTAGVWKSEDPQPRYSLTNWSPIRPQAAKIEHPDLPKMAREWFMEIVALALKAMNNGFSKRLKNKWPTRCAFFLTRGRFLSR